MSTHRRCTNCEASFDAVRDLTLHNAARHLWSRYGPEKEESHTLKRSPPWKIFYDPTGVKKAGSPPAPLISATKSYDFGIFWSFWSKKWPRIGKKSGKNGKFLASRKRLVIKIQYIDPLWPNSRPPRNSRPIFMYEYKAGFRRNEIGWSRSELGKEKGRGWSDNFRIKYVG